jgi:hypothetical protein
MSPKFPLKVADKQRIMYVNPLPPEDLVRWGDRYRDAGLFHDALDFYQAAENAEAARALAGKAIEIGDLVLLQNIYRTVGEPVPKEDLKALQEKAQAQGKTSEAKRAEVLLVPAK